MKLLFPMIGLLGLSLAGCKADRDHDGARGNDDCDDRAPFVYPGAPDDPEDGVDADCDGVDPAYLFLGDWSLETFSAAYAGYALFVPNSESGGLTVADDLTSTLAINATLDPAVTGNALPINLAFTGYASPLPGPDLFTVSADTLAFGEQMHVDLDCAVDSDAAGIACVGELKALEASLDTSIVLAPAAP